MKTIIGRTLAVVLCSMGILRAQPIHFTRIDKNHSTVGFSVSIMKGISKVTGKFMEFDAEIVYHENDLKASSIKVTVDVASIDTGVDDRDKHLRSGDFFGVEQHPRATFESRRLVKRGEETFAIGTFSLRGISKEIEVPFRVTGLNKYESNKSPGEMRATFAVAAAFTINRWDYGIKWQHNSVAMFVSDEVSIDINLLTRSTKVEKNSGDKG
jgi:polyisoprenoid-binding protein YceI